MHGERTGLVGTVLYLAPEMAKPLSRYSQVRQAAGVSVAAG